jgi:hypothetical protein
LRDLTDDAPRARAYVRRVSDREAPASGPAEQGGADDGLISRFWKEPAPAPPPSGPPSEDGEETERS